MRKLLQIIKRTERAKEKISHVPHQKRHCHDPKTGLMQRSDLRDVNWEVSDKIMFLPRIRFCEKSKISKHIKNISQKLTWRCDPEPVAIGFRVALNLSA